MTGIFSRLPSHRTRRLAALLGVGLLALSAALLPAPSARAAVYWSNDGAIGAANLDGRLRQPAYYRPDPEAYVPLGGVAVSADHLYWGGRSGIGRVPLFGPEIPEHIVTTSSPVTGLVLDGTHVYWTTMGGEAIGRAGLDGGAANPQLVDGIKDLRGIAVDTQHLYWTSTNSIGRSTLDGLGVERTFRYTDLFPSGIAVGGGSIYWSQNGGEAIERAAVAGGPGEAVVRDAGWATALALDAGNLYWSPGYGPNPGIGRVVLASRLTEPNWLPIDAFRISGFAVDSLASPPPIPPKSMPPEIVSVGRNPGKGFVFVNVQVPVMGKLRVLAPSFAWKILGKERRGAEVPPGRWRIKLWAGRGTGSERLRSRLSHQGRASVKLILSLKELGKDPATTEKKVTFVRRAKRPGSRPG